MVLSLPYVTKPAYLLILAQKLMDLLVPLFKGNISFSGNGKISCSRAGTLIINVLVGTVAKISKSSSESTAGEMGNAYIISLQYSNL